MKKENKKQEHCPHCKRHCSLNNPHCSKGEAWAKEKKKQKKNKVKSVKKQKQNVNKQISEEENKTLLYLLQDCNTLLANQSAEGTTAFSVLKKKEREYLESVLRKLSKRLKKKGEESHE
ncbi:hypothetical protein [Konateibacter massiliensis]|uniref:hypothetical protein n=1 Tax=Konateibacter massiliensis TaxID=2002841 RepID=UPI000C151BDF|nr:hypothetical protein [Konateibacter massiliensis]